MQTLQNMISGQYNAAVQRANTPVSVPPAARRPPGYAGGHLPFRLGVTNSAQQVLNRPAESPMTGDYPGTIPDGVRPDSGFGAGGGPYPEQRDPGGGEAPDTPEIPEMVRTQAPSRLTPAMLSSVPGTDDAGAQDPTTLSLNLLQSAARRRSMAA